MNLVLFLCKFTSKIYMIRESLYFFNLSPLQYEVLLVGPYPIYLLYGT